MSTSSPYTGSRTLPHIIGQRRWWWALLAVWALLVAAALQLHSTDIRRQSLEVATEGARNMFRMVVLTRGWNATHGGVYVPVSPGTQPNPYLDVPRRDVTTTDGQHLTLVNPAYMTRLIAERAHADSGAVFRLTSLRPIRPENAPDSWERLALQAMEQGAREVVEAVAGEPGKQLRYMAPLVVEQACLACHAKQGYKLGDIRGGISVSQQWAPIEAASLSGIRQAQWNYGGVFLVVAALGWWLLELLRRRWGELDSKIWELEHTRNELVQSEKLASLGRMVAGFAHEINTPVGVAVGAVSHNEESLQRIDGLLQAEEVSEEQLRSELDSLRQGGALALANLRRAAGLVQSFKRTSIDQSSDQSRSFNMKELIDDVLFTLQGHLKRLPVCVAVDCPGDLTLDGVPGSIEQLLTNLVMNAVQHGFDGGRRAGQITIRVRRDGRDIDLQFTDDGAGMSAQSLARIFEPFFTTSRERGGSGLGLYICYNIVTARLGGSIRCDSEPEKGCRFDVRFPAQAPTMKPAETP